MSPFTRSPSSLYGYVVLGLVAIGIGFGAGWHATLQEINPPPKMSVPSQVFADGSTNPSTVEIPYDSSKLNTITNNELSRRLDEILALPDAQERTTSLADLTRSLHPDQIQAVLDRLKTDQPKFKNSWELISELAKKNPAATFSWAQSISDPKESRRAQQATLETWGETEPETALSHIQKVKNAYRKRDLFNRIFSNWMEKDLYAAKDYLSSAKPGEVSSYAYNQCATKMAHDNPREALDWIKRVRGNADDGYGYEYAIIREWLKNAPKEATDYVAAMKHGIAQEAAIRDVLTELMQQNPREALDWIRKLESKQMQTKAIMETMGQWAKQEPQVAADYARGTLKGRQQSMALKSVLSQWTTTAPATAASYAQLIPDLKLKSDLSAIVAQGWSAKDPVAAAAWATSLTEGMPRSEALKSVMDQWAGIDPAKASVWLETLPAGLPRDEAVGAFIRKVAGKDPDMAMHWADSIADESMRTQSQKQVICSWLKTNPNAAKAWIDASDLPQEAKSKLLTEPDKK